MATSADFKPIVEELTEEYGKPPTPKQLVAAVGGKDLLSMADALTILSDLCTPEASKPNRKRKEVPKAAAKAVPKADEVPEEPAQPEEVKNEKAESMEMEDVDGKVPTEEEMASWNMFQDKEDPTEQETQPAEAAAVELERGTSQRCGLTCPY